MYAEHDLVVLTRDLPTVGLHAGAVGAIVGIYASGGYEVEFVSVTGRTVTVVPLSSNDIRPGTDHEHALPSTDAQPRGRSQRRR